MTFVFSVRSTDSFSKPITSSNLLQRSIITSAKIIPLSLAIGVANAGADSSISGNANSIVGEDLPLGKDGYTTLGDIQMCRLLNGMWQVSGAHGYQPNTDDVVAEMARCVDSGFTTFDLADIYGPAEEYVGEFSRGSRSSSLSKYSQFFTKWVPRPQDISRSLVTNAINKSLYRMRTETIDLLQFHWWDYSNRNYFNAAENLMTLQQEGKIRNLGLTNFDTKHMSGLVDEGMPVVSNQVSFSILDSRPLQLMVPFCKEKGVKLLCYGSLLGGFLSSYWLGKYEPSYDSLTNVSLRKYLPWIQAWGGWARFQELLAVLDSIGKRYDVSPSAVAINWVLCQPAVGGAIVGVRFGLRQHLVDNRKVLSFTMDEQDLAAIDAVRAKGRDLMNVFGDCGGEYRRSA